MGIRGKDGAEYHNVDELMKANARWEQQERQNTLLEEQNRLRKQEIERQEELQEKKRINDLMKQIELKEQTRIEKERLFIETLHEDEKEQYIYYKKELDNKNRTFNEAIDLKQIYINNKHVYINELQQLQMKLKRIGFAKIMIITFLLSVIAVGIMYWNSSDIVILSVLGIYTIIVTIYCIDYTKKHRKANTLFKDVGKDIKEFSTKIDNLNTIEEPIMLEYIYMIGLENVPTYIREIDNYCTKLLNATEELKEQHNQIKTQINQVLDDLNSIYKKNDKKLDM